MYKFECLCGRDGSIFHHVYCATYNRRRQAEQNEDAKKQPAPLQDRLQGRKTDLLAKLDALYYQIGKDYVKYKADTSATDYKTVVNPRVNEAASIKVRIDNINKTLNLIEEVGGF